MTKVINRIICGVLTLTLCCGLCIVGAAKEDGTRLTDEQSDALEVLRQLDIISDFYDYNVTLDENITRADFANIVARIVNLDTYNGTNTYYYDVPQNHYAYGAICALTRAGILNGTEKKIFRPDDPIEYAAAYKILLTLMGYNTRAEAMGGYPAGYLRIAARVGIVDAAPADDYMTRGEMLTAVYRAIKTEMYEPVWITSDGVSKYTVSKTETLLTLYHDIYYGKGVVNGAEMYSLTGISLNSADEVAIDKNIYKSEISLIDMLGEQIEYFMYYDKVTEAGTILWAETTGVTEVIFVDEEHKKDFDKDTFTFSYLNESGKSKSISLDHSITVIYNGKEVDRDIDDIFMLPCYSVKLLKNETGYHTAVVRAYNTIVAETIDTNDFVIYDVRRTSEPLKLAEHLYDYISIKNSGNTKISFSDIAAGDVLSIFLSEDEKMIEVIVSSRSDSGVIQQISKSGQNTAITVNGTAYIKAQNASFDIPAVGTNATLYMDHRDMVVYVGNLISNSFVAYVIQIKKVEEAFDEELKFRALQENGEVVYLDCAETVFVDGKKAENTDEVINAFKNPKTGEHLPQLAMLNTDKDGKVKRIDTAYVRPGVEDIRYTLSVDVDKVQDVSYRWLGYFTINTGTNDNQPYAKNAVIVNNDTKIFKVPTSFAAEDKDFSVVGRSSLNDYEKYNIKTYKVSDRPGYTKWMEIEASTGTTYESKTVLVKEKLDVLDDEGEIRHAIVGYQGNTEVTYYAARGKESLFNSVDTGTLISIIKNFRGEVESIQVEFTPDMQGPFDNSADAYWESRGKIKGYVYDIVDGVIKISYDMPAEFDEGQVEQRWTAHTAPVIIYDKEKADSPVYVGSFSDAKTYYNVEEKCSRIVLSCSAGEPVMYVIYK